VRATFKEYHRADPLPVVQGIALNIEDARDLIAARIDYLTADAQCGG
jgi:hypothetical protein